MTVSGNRQFGLILCSAMLLAACGGSEPPAPTSEQPAAATAPVDAAATASARRYADVNQERIIAEETTGENWLSYGRTYNEQRFSPLTRITKENVDQLGLA